MNRPTKAQRRALANTLLQSQGYREIQAIRAKADKRRRLRRSVIHIAMLIATFAAVAAWVRACETQLTAIEGS